MNTFQKEYPGMRIPGFRNDAVQYQFDASSAVVKWDGFFWTCTL